MGSRAFRYFWSPVDDRMTAQLRRGGFVILGKLATSELGALPVTEPDIHDATRNPWNLGVTPGGSSGGSALRSPRACSRSRRGATEQARSAFRPRSAICTGSSHRAGASPTRTLVRITRRSRRAVRSRTPSRTPLRCSTSWPASPSALRTGLRRHRGPTASSCTPRRGACAFASRRARPSSTRIRRSLLASGAPPRCSRGSARRRRGRDARCVGRGVPAAVAALRRAPARCPLVPVQPVTRWLAEAGRLHGDERRSRPARRALAARARVVR